MLARVVQISHESNSKAIPSISFGNRAQLRAQVPNARVFDDFGKAAMGRRGQRLVYATVYGTILLNPIIFQLTSVESLDQIFYQQQLPKWAMGLIVAGIILPLAQVSVLSRSQLRSPWSAPKCVRPCGLSASNDLHFAERNDCMSGNSGLDLLVLPVLLSHLPFVART